MSVGQLQPGPLCASQLSLDSLESKGLRKVTKFPSAPGPKMAPRWKGVGSHPHL